jgi:predicted site-specific integrase-resolvase
MALEPRKKQGLTTGEAARILGISVPTVIRYFNEGILTGWKNPITGRMVIDLKSVETLKAIRRKRNATKKS